MVKRILIIAGSDSSAGAGIQADLKTVSALGGYGMTAITAITAQNTLGVQAVHPVPPEIVAEQIRSCLSDIGADAIKIGMLANAEIIQAVEQALITPSPQPSPPLGERESARTKGHIPLILDPVMVATSGDKLLGDAALQALGTLMARADVITPNIPEAELLSGLPITNQDEMLLAAKQLQFMTGGAAVVLKGGHLKSAQVHDLLLQEGEAFWFESERYDTPHTHGTGCTLASAITAFGAQGNALPEAVSAAIDYVNSAIANAPGLGQGHGPLGHF